jgi:hypothetical protein
MEMMTSIISSKMVNQTKGTSKELNNKILKLKKSVSEVYKYELLTTNQYLNQMELVLDILQDISKEINI